ncbi:MAG: RidA family protein [Deltaproteobacteria bacterium]|jgi:2-iminobutanoate/2-iminopropanoate deaminase|nr:RidA family protein [Deltaproteobacteria bacterium]
MKQPVETLNAPKAIGPYSQAIVAGQTIYVSGQLPINPTDGIIPSETVDQACQALRNIQAILEAAGSSLDDVVRVGIFLTDLEDFTVVNEIYQSFFSPPYPARSTVEVMALPKAAKLEIEAIAVK